MGKCIIIAPLYQGEETAFLRKEPGDLLICADAGYDAALRCGLVPDLCVGDFDSMPADHVHATETVTLPVRKDDTDMVVCLRQGRQRGYTSFRIGGALGGRLDHTLANLQCLTDCALRGEEAWICDSVNRVTVLTPGSHRIPAMPHRLLSLLALTPEVHGISLRGTLWELEDATLTQRWPLGCSNEFRSNAAELSFQDGLLALILSKDSAHDVSEEKNG